MQRYQDLIERHLSREMPHITDSLYTMAGDERLWQADSAATPAEPMAAMTYSHDTILADMAEARTIADKLETLTAKEYWPFPVYSDLLFSV